MWKGKRNQLIILINKLNKIHITIEIKYEILSQKKPLSDKMGYKD